ncbi:MAG: LacI family DNA-binding transcriptional regulator [Lachnospiraceae bacterium]|nr:LacI family DNA-binding transcriptional regulator [Lachnospiraceae bacterium]MBP3610714.1 LacI family DNA-binding transcriptional regulator [Lachnospiraceae bacterium]
MNIYDVSEKAGVSIATVSRVLNGNPNVSEPTRQKVLNVMKEIGYTPNVFARGLGLNTMHTIGIMCADSSDPFLANAVYYLEQNLRKCGYDSFLCCTGYDLINKQKYLQLLLSKRVDAIILVGSSFLEAAKKDNSYITAAADTIPVMVINGYINHPNIYCTLCDDYQAVYDVVNRLIDQGRRDILYLYTSRSYSGLQKLSGYKNSISSNGLIIQEDLMISCPNDITQTKDILMEQQKKGLHFDAVVASEDQLAVAAVKFAKQQGLSVPDDIAIVGYNNSILSGCTDPELTSIDNHVETLCMTTISTLMRVLDGNDVPNKTTISNDIAERETTNF